MAQPILTVTLDDDDRPTLPARARFDEETERFFSNVETLPEIVPDASFYARLAEATNAPAEDEVARWMAEQRRSVHVRLVTVLLAASLAILFVGALR